MSKRGIPKPTFVTTKIASSGASGAESKTSITQVKPCPGPNSASQASSRSCKGPCATGSRIPQAGFAQQYSTSDFQPRQSGVRFPSAPPQRSTPVPQQRSIPGPQPRSIPAPGYTSTPKSRIPAPSAAPQQRAIQPPGFTSTPNRRPPAPSGQAPKQDKIAAPRFGSKTGPPTSTLFATKQRPPGSRPSKQQNLNDEIEKTLSEKREEAPDTRVAAKASKRTKICTPECIDTPTGPETVLQKTVIETRVERDEAGEKIIKHVAVSDLDDEKGVLTERIQFGIQQFDPAFPRPSGKEIIGVTSTVSITETYKTISKECTRVTVDPVVTMSPAEVAQLVEEEKEDVENTLKMVPADLVLEPGKYEIKQRLQRLRINSESMALLEQSIIYPQPTADEVQTEPSPEAMASMMHSVETGISPQSAPDQVFNSLFTETANEQFVKVSSIAPGPLQDAVAPGELPQDIHQVMISENMAKLAEKMGMRSSADEVPYVDIFDKVMDDAAKSPEKGKNKHKSFQISEEKSPWANADIEHLVNVVGAEPADVLEPIDLMELDEDKLAEEMANGVDYFVTADPVQYMSRVQLRGSQLPSFFPGYMIALPDYPDIIQIARNPDEVFASAWKAVQPKYFDNDSTITTSF